MASQGILDTAMKKKRSKADYLVGVDVDGSRIMAGIFTRELRLLKATRISTNARGGGDAVLERIVRCIKDLLEARDLDLSQVSAVGVGAPGIIDSKSGTVVVAPLLQWENFALKARLAHALGRPVVIQNDCSVTMAAIYAVELRRKPRNALGIFMGTGLGGALVLDGRLYSGSAGIAGEVGHIVVEKLGPICGCGSRGCFEVFASRSGMADRLRAALKKRGATSVLAPLLEKDRLQPGTLRSADLKKAVKQGDKLATSVVHDAAEYTGIALANLINLLSPDVVVLGGEIIHSLKAEMMPIINEQVQAHALLRFLRKPEVVATKLGEKGGILGAAVLARKGGSL
jgi:glucokinase